MKKFILLFCLLIAFTISFSQTGQLDPSFGNKGLVITDAGIKIFANTTGYQSLQASDGSIYTIFFLGQNSTYHIAKRFINGITDSSYGTYGISKPLPIASKTAVMEADDKIIILGGNQITRILTTGVIDSSFGTNGLAHCLMNMANGITIATSGKIYVAGYSTLGSTMNDQFYATEAYNNDGSVDSSFNGTGIVVSDFGFRPPPNREYFAEGDLAETVAVQPDGKILVAGHADTYSTGLDFALVRYNVNGTFDSSFGSNGKQFTDISSGGDETAYDILLTSDNKIVLAGYTGYYSFAVTRYTASGTPDSTFNHTAYQTGIAVTDPSFEPFAILQNDNGIVLSGSAINGSTEAFVLEKFTSSGSIDSSFGVNGFVYTNVDSLTDVARNILRQQDDKFIVTGNTMNADVSTLVRYYANGKIDSSFNKIGKALQSYNQGSTIFNAVQITSDKKIVAGGITTDSTGTALLIARYNEKGVPDSSFGVNGKQITNFGRDVFGNTLVIQNDGKYILTSNIAIVRYTVSGQLDSTFNGNGKLVTAATTDTLMPAAALQQDSKIILAGTTFDESTSVYKYAVYRLNTDGSYDTTFGHTGKIFNSFTFGSSVGTCTGVQPNGKILVGGYSIFRPDIFTATSGFILARYNTDGSLDSSFGDGGVVNTVFGSDRYIAQSLAIQSDGKIIMGGYTQNNDGSVTSFFIARFKGDGSLDSSFNQVGFSQPAGVGNNASLAVSVALKDDGRIALGGADGSGNFGIILFKTDGSLDSTFGTNGIVNTVVSSYNHGTLKALTFAPDALYAVGSGQYPGKLGVIAKYSFASSVLPIALFNFEGTLQSNSILLQWQVALAAGLNNFIVEKSTDNLQFIPIGTVLAKRSNLNESYTFPDTNPVQGLNYYRLILTDAEGTKSYSKIISVNYTSLINVFKLYPNPATDLIIVAGSTIYGHTLLRLINSAGSTVKSLDIYLHENETYGIGISNLPKGVYILDIRTAAANIQKQFVKK